MFTSLSKPNKAAYLVGLGLVLLSLLFFLFPFYGILGVGGRDPFLGFFFHYVLIFIYGILLIVLGASARAHKERLFGGNWIHLVVLASISAFALNRFIPVFQPFPTWMNVYTILSLGLLLLIPHARHFKPFWKSMIYFWSGLSMFYSLYMFLFVLPMIPFGLIVVWFFGLPLLLFVPGLWLWVLIHFLLRQTERPRLKLFALLGFALPMTVLGIYSYQWQQTKTTIDTLLASERSGKERLPKAILLAQQLPNDPITDEILMAPEHLQQVRMGDVPWGGRSSGLLHDPPAVIANTLFGDINLDEASTEALLNIRKNYRHHTQNRFWSGEHLSTASLHTNIEVLPEYRLAYQEKKIHIHLDDKDRAPWFREEEALYTFHVPEGGIVTSLSLWIDGREEQSRLSTRRKADSAYTNIVGVTRRDPAMVHWQEGNQVTVRVYPCTAKEDRVFKIGFTTPLSARQGKLWLDNVWMEGPDFEDAEEAIEVKISGNAHPIELPEGFEEKEKGLVYNGNYHSHWSMGFEPLALSKEIFSFNGNDYFLKEAVTTQQNVRVSEIYLDLNTSWTNEEYEKVLRDLKRYPLYAWQPQKTRITEENQKRVWEETQKNHFSLPFLYDLKDPAHSLVITKSDVQSPILSDMRESAFAEQILRYFEQSPTPLRVINIGESLNPFWRSLNELRLINYTQINLVAAVAQIDQQRFTTYVEDSNTVTLRESHLSIVRQGSADSLRKGHAPDHLLRLFAYNDLLRKIGPHYYHSRDYEDPFFREAEEGYVVSPISSMIVLESQQAYTNMSIPQNQNSLGNAGAHSGNPQGGGAVPEPHEWLLIGLVAAFVVHHLYGRYKHRFHF